MTASAVPRVKQSVRAVNMDDCIRFARRVMEQSDPELMRELVMESAPGGG
jgi:phosphotransferase system enzyme I (PtsI)